MWKGKTYPKKTRQCPSEQTPVIRNIVAFIILLSIFIFVADGSIVSIPFLP
jgi:hypothetical protein